jgi:hypothetical protein
MTEQYGQPSINLQSSSPTTIYIRGLSDLDNFAPADLATGERRIFTPAGSPGVELRIEGCGFEVADPADAIYDNATAGAVTPGAGPAADLISRSNVLLDSPPVLIAQNPV